MLPLVLQPARAAYTALRRFIGRIVFERPRGIETSEVVRLHDIGIDNTDRGDYEPSPWLVLRRVLAKSEVAPHDVFLDLGSGKGPVVLQAAEYPFAKVIGVELSAELHRSARVNLERARHSLRCRNVELVNCDVLDYAIPDEVTVIYLYNPFNGRIFRSVTRRIVESIERKPRTVRIIYLNPVEEDTLLAAGARIVKTRRGWRPGKAWARLNTINVYELAPSA